MYCNHNQHTSTTLNTNTERINVYRALGFAVLFVMAVRFFLLDYVRTMFSDYVRLLCFIMCGLCV